MFFRFDDPEVQREIEVSPHKIVNREGKPHIQFGDRVFSREDLLAVFVRKVKGLAEDHFRKRIRKAVFLVPGLFAPVKLRVNVLIYNGGL